MHFSFLLPWKTHMRGRGSRRTARSSNKLDPSCLLQCPSRISLLPHYFISCWMIIITGSSRMLEGILSRIIIFAYFDRASSRLSQTCPGVFANAMFTICKMWLHKLQSSGVCTQSTRAWGLSLKSYNHAKISTSCFSLLIVSEGPSVLRFVRGEVPRSRARWIWKSKDTYHTSVFALALNQWNSV